MNVRIVLLVLLALVGLSASAEATNYYVRQGVGNDANNCTAAESPSTAKATIGDFIGDCGQFGTGVFGPGDTLFVGAGTYAESFQGSAFGAAFQAAGTAGNLVTITNYNSETVTLTGAVGASFVIGFDTQDDYVEVKGFIIDGSVRVTSQAVLWPLGADHNKFTNNTVIGGRGHNNCAAVCGPFGTDNVMSGNIVHGGAEDVTGGACGTPCSNYAFYFGGVDNIIEGGEVYDVAGAGIQISQGNGPPTRPIIRGVRIHDVTRSGFSDGAVWAIIVAAQVDDPQIYNNLIYENGAGTGANDAGLRIFNAEDALVYNNTIYGNNAYGLQLYNSSVRTIARNNILYSNSYGNYNNTGVSTTEDHNARDGTNPQFADPANGDFRLTAGSTVAINAGIAVAQVTVDYAGVTRADPPDIGAYEYNSVPRITSATGTVIVTQTFTQASGTNLSFLNFTKQTGSTGDAVVSTANRARSNSTGQVRYYLDTATLSNSYDVQESWHVFSLPLTYYIIGARMSTSVETQYFCGYDVANVRFYLEKWVTGTNTVLATYPYALSVGSDHTVTFKVRPTEIGCELDDEPILYLTESSIATGKPGMGWYSATSDTDSTGIHRDTFTVTDVETSVPGTPPTAFPFGIRVMPP